VESPFSRPSARACIKRGKKDPNGAPYPIGRKIEFRGSKEKKQEPIKTKKKRKSPSGGWRERGRIVFKLKMGGKGKKKKGAVNFLPQKGDSLAIPVSYSERG